MMEGLKSPSFLISNDSRMIDQNQVKQVCQQWLEDKEYFLVSVDVDKENKITVEIDHKDGVWIEDCCQLSRFIEEHFDREVEDYELEVGSAGIGQPLKVVQQYVNLISKDVEVMTLEGKKLTGILADADAEGFTFCYKEKQKVEGKKCPVAVDVEKRFAYDGVKWVRAVIEF